MGRSPTPRRRAVARSPGRPAAGEDARKGHELRGRWDPVASTAPLSYSSYHTYSECPLRWKFLYVDHLPETPHGYFTFGRVVHSVLEDLVRPLLVPGARRTAVGEAQRTLDDWHATGRPALDRSSDDERGVVGVLRPGLALGGVHLP